MPKRCFCGFSDDFSFSLFFCSGSGKRVWPPVHKWNKPSPTAGKLGRMILFARPDTSGRTDKTIFPYRWFARFHATGYALLCWELPFFTDFSFEVFCLICLYFRLPPFSRLSANSIRQSFPFWAQRQLRDLTGKQGQASCFFLEKNWHSRQPQPYWYFFY